MKFRNICPNGARTIPDLNDLIVEAGALVEVPDAFGKGMAGQTDVWQLVKDEKPKKDKEASE